MGTATPKATWSEDDVTWYYTAPIGYRFGGDLHEFVYDKATWGTKREAKADAEDREDAEPLELCTGECDWCERYDAGEPSETWLERNHP